MPALTQVANYRTRGYLTSAGIGAAYADLIAGVEGSVRKIVISNSLNTEVVLSLDNGTTDFIVLQPNSAPLVLDLDVSMHWAGTIRVKHNGVAPASGAISAGVILGV